MAVYEYLCPDDGAFEVRAPIGSAPDDAPCPACSLPARRRILAPRLSLGNARARTLLDATARSAAEPAVVGSPPPRPSARTSSQMSSNPLHRKLPRP